MDKIEQPLKFKLIIIGSEAPKQHYGHAIWRRMRTIPFYSEYYENLEKIK